MARLLRRVESLPGRRAEGFGAKARNLATLTRAGFRVPPAYALGVDAFREVIDRLPEADRPEALLRSGEFDQERLEAIAARIRTSPLPRRIVSGLRDAFAVLTRGEGVDSVAVRSSSTREDRVDSSGAGLHSTYLNVRDPDQLADAVRKCWASFYDERVLSYLRARPLSTVEGVGIGVVVQAMVPAEAAGVLFTINPLTGDAGEVVINVAWGLGETVVAGKVSPDTIRVDKATGGYRDRVIGSKDIRTVLARDGGVHDEAVPDETRAELALDDVQTEALTALALRIEDHFGAPQDVEFALHAGEIWVLQARPVTTSVQAGTRRRARPQWLERFERRERGEAEDLSGGRSRARTRFELRDRRSLVWSNLNVGEALPGVATPLTWSVLSGFSDIGFRRALGSLGLTVPKDAELFGAFRGRIYLNLTELFGVLSQIPGLRPKTLLSLGGGGEGEHLEEAIEPRSPTAFLGRLPLTVSRFVRENRRLSERLEDFESTFSFERERLRTIEPSILTPSALAATFRDAERLLEDTGAEMLTVYGNVLASTVFLGSALHVVAGEDALALQRDLLAGLSDLDSAAPGLSLYHIGQMAKGEPEVARLIREGDPTELRVESLPDGATRRALTNFFLAYGHRGAREAEIAEPRWREDPTLIFTSLRLHLGDPGAGTPAPRAVEERQRVVRERAEQLLTDRIPMPTLPVFRHLLRQAQRFLRLRERLRAHVVEVLDIYRVLALDTSRRIAVREEGVGEDAAFYLTLDEIYRALGPNPPAVAARIAQRRQQVQRDRALPDPPDTFVGYPPPVSEIPPSEDGPMMGLGASGGHVRARARVVFSPADAAGFQSGEVLVAPCADVGWSPLFLAAGAVVTDLGGPLSHAAIVLREYGVPSVVNVKSATRRIRTGDLLRVDGDAGIVEVLESAEAST